MWDLRLPTSLIVDLCHAVRSIKYKSIKYKVQHILCNRAVTLLSLGPWNVSLLAHAFSLGMPRTSTRRTSLQSSELTFQVNFSGTSEGKCKVGKWRCLNMRCGMIIREAGVMRPGCHPGWGHCAPVSYDAISRDPLGTLQYLNLKDTLYLTISCTLE